MIWPLRPLTACRRLESREDAPTIAPTRSTRRRLVFRERLCPAASRLRGDDELLLAERVVNQLSKVNRIVPTSSSTPNTMPTPSTTPKAVSTARSGRVFS